MKGDRGMTTRELALQLEIHPDTITALEQYWCAPDACDNVPLADLAWILEAVLPIREQYARLGIPESIYWDTVKDIRIWAEDYREKTGCHGVLKRGWLSNIPQMRIFRIGRVQYIPEPLEYDVVIGDKKYPKGMEVLGMHIPAGEPLDATAVQESLTSVKAFYETYFGKEYTVVLCRSWLLAPELRELLKPTSGIIGFQNLFTVYKAVPHIQAIERVFGEVQEDAANYPETTSLQRSLKAYLLAGKQTTMGCGIIALPD